MVETSTSLFHLDNIRSYYKSVLEFTNSLSTGSLPANLNIFRMDLQYIKSEDTHYDCSIPEFKYEHRDQEILMDEETYFTNIVILLLHQGYQALEEDPTKLIKNSIIISECAEFILNSSFLKIVSEVSERHVQVYVRSTLYELATVNMCNIPSVTRYLSITPQFRCTPVPKEDLELYEYVVRTDLVKKAFEDLDPRFNPEYLERAITYICEPGHLYYANMGSKTLGVTCYGYVYLHNSFSDNPDNALRVCRLLTLLNETAHVLVRLGYPPRSWPLVKSPKRNILSENENYIPETMVEVEEGHALEAKLFTAVPKRIYESAVRFLTKKNSWNLDRVEFQSNFVANQVVGQSSGEDSILVSSDLREPYISGVKCGSRSFLGIEEPVDTCKKHLTF